MNEAVIDIFSQIKVKFSRIIIITLKVNYIEFLKIINNCADFSETKD